MELVSTHIELNLSKTSKLKPIYSGITTLKFQVADDYDINDCYTQQTALRDTQIQLFAGSSLPIHIGSSINVLQCQVVLNKRTLKIKKMGPYVCDMQDINHKNQGLQWIEIAQPLPINQFGSVITLTVKFTGIVHTPPLLQGLYWAGKHPTIEDCISSQFEVYFAREAFPCLDIPPIKSVVSFTITPPLGTKLALTNTLTDRLNSPSDVNCNSVYRFHPSNLPLPMYVTAVVIYAVPVHFITKSITILSDSSDPDPILIRAVSIARHHMPVEDVLEKLEMALRLFTKVLDMHLYNAKLDIAFIPTMALGGMESDGLITLNEAILADRRKCSVDHGKVGTEVIKFIVHEVCHHWLGNTIGLPFLCKEALCLLFEDMVTSDVLSSQFLKECNTKCVVAAYNIEELVVDKELTGKTYQNAELLGKKLLQSYGLKKLISKLQDLLKSFKGRYVSWDDFTHAFDLAI